MPIEKINHVVHNPLDYQKPTEFYSLQIIARLIL